MTSCSKFLDYCCPVRIDGGARYKDGEAKISCTWRKLSLKELLAATNKFNVDNRLGEAQEDFGSIYWGHLRDGSQAKVKFAVEVEILGRVRHKNLLNLREYCAEVVERLIVYDYMPLLSLSAHLHGQHADDCHLDWRRRMHIALGSAEGVAFLHHHATPHIIHRDIKASNVLLDANFNAQVAGFGVAKLIPDGATHITIRVKGPVSYVAPEYAMWGKASQSSDVYSFGILLLELISGKRPIEKLRPRRGPGIKRTIIEWAPLIFHGNFSKLLDPKLKGKFIHNELRILVRTVTMCAQISPDNRPSA